MRLNQVDPNKRKAQQGASAWDEFAAKFDALADKERSLQSHRHNRQELGVRREDPPFRRPGSAGFYREGWTFMDGAPFCDWPRRTPEGERYTLLEGPYRNDTPDEDFRQRYKTLAEDAGKKLGPKPSIDPLNYWFYSLFAHIGGKKNTERQPIRGNRHATVGELYSNADNSDSILGMPENGKYIPSLCKASATFCLALQQTEIRTEPESDTQTTSKAPKRSQRKRRLTKRELDLIGLIDAGYRSQRYAAEAESRKIPPRHEWIEEGCPVNYALAFKNPKWRQRIYDEKSRLARFSRAKSASH